MVGVWEISPRWVRDTNADGFLDQVHRGRCVVELDWGCRVYSIDLLKSAYSRRSPPTSFTVAQGPSFKHIAFRICKHLHSTSQALSHTPVSQAMQLYCPHVPLLPPIPLLHSHLLSIHSAKSSMLRTQNISIPIPRYHFYNPSSIVGNLEAAKGVGFEEPYLNEPDILRLFPEALTADVEAVFANETCLVDANAASIIQLATILVYKGALCACGFLETDMEVVGIAKGFWDRYTGGIENLRGGASIPRPTALPVCARARVPD